MSAKSHHSAVALVPPEALWTPIQEIRRRHDRQLHRWMPHINLLYPFRPQSDFPSLAADLADACKRIEPFPLTLAEFHFFHHGSGRCTLWLAPEPVEKVRQLQATLQVAFPDCDDLSRFPNGYTPHLSVGQFATIADCQRVQAQLQADWQAITFTLVEVALLAREGNTPFTVERRINLGTDSANGRPQG